MFTQPINQSGLSGFIPVRRQEGGVPNQELDIGQIADNKLNFDIFGRRISGGPIAQTTTNIGQIANPQQLAPGLPQGGISSLIPVDGGADDPFVDAPEVSFDTVTEGIANLGEDISGKVSEFGENISGKFDAFMDNPLEESLEYAEKGVENFARNALTSLAKTPVTVPLYGAIFDIANQARKGEDPFSKSNLTNTSINFALSTLAAFVPALALPVMLVKFVYDTFFGEEGLDAEDLETRGYNIDMDIAPPGTFGPEPGPIYTGSYGEPESPVDLENMGYNIDMDIAPGGATPTGGPPGGDSPGGDADGEDSGEGGTPGCWVAGTKVLMADSTYCNIEDLKIGDMVMSFPETKKTRRWNTPLEPQPIISLLVDVHPEIWHLNDSMVSGTEWIIKGDGTAAIVQWLNIGDTVLGPDNNLIKVTRVEPAEGELKKQVIYNFETKFNYSYTANNMRTIRGRAVRAPERGPWSEEYLAGDANAYEGSMQDEYDKKFKTYTS